MSHPIRRVMLFSLLSYAVTVLVIFTASTAFSKERTPAPLQKVIDFEDEVVEGMNKKPLDSLSQISERERRRRKAHLYRKRAGFRSETAATLNTLRFVQ